ncbi:hypothetical protein DTO012A8_9851 [Penicillium roqueforti]|nr:hypothetical protein DTO012A8_9851 [Penicillium roqueforti]
MDYFLTQQERQQYGDAMQYIPWFGGNHDSAQRYPVVPFREYLEVRNCLPARNVIKWILSDPDEALPMVQAWLFFGVIESALFDSFSASLRDTPQGKVIDTKILRGLKVSWELRLSGVGWPISQWRDQWDDTRVKAEAILFGLGALAKSSLSGEVSLPESTETALDHIVRGSLLLLEHMISIAPPVLYERRPMQTLMSMRTPGMEEQLRGRLLSQGWCPSMYNTFGSISGSLHLLEYACIFPATDGPTERHEACSEERCIGHNLDVDTAKAKHRQPDCKCESVAPGLHQIIAAVDGGSFPVIDMRRLQLALMPGISDSQRDHMRYSAVSKYQEGMKFAAISHVWSDGLMGTSETGLPGCQIQHLAGLACASAQSSLHPESAQVPWYLWIDALCIPADSRVRKMAITKMRQVYSEASMTIVLDNGLYSTPENLTGFSIMFRLMTCAWSRRLWTLQEAILSKSLYILFPAGLAEVSSLFRDVLDGTDEPIDDERLHGLSQLTGLSFDEVQRLDQSCRTRPSNSIETLMLREFRSLPSLTNVEFRMKQVSQMLCLRDSSRPEDELLAIAPLLGVDVSQLVHMSGEDRVKNFWLQLGTVPKDVVLLEYPKLSTPGFRCLPRAMLGQKLQEPMHWGRDVLITDQGVRGRYWVYQWSKDSGSTQSDTHGSVVDMEADQVIDFKVHDYEPNRDSVSIDALLLLDLPAHYSEVRSRSFRGLGLCSSGFFHEGCEIFRPGRILYCYAAPPLTDWDGKDCVFAAGKIVEIIIG